MANNIKDVCLRGQLFARLRIERQQPVWHCEPPSVTTTLHSRESVRTATGALMVEQRGSAAVCAQNPAGTTRELDLLRVRIFTRLQGSWTLGTTYQ
eukprot:2457625-Amphidinium_carterae.3